MGHFLKKKSRYNSHKIQHVKVQYLGFIIYNYLRIHCVCTHHYLIPHFHHPRKKPRTYQQSVPLPVPKPQPLATADRLSAPTDFDCLILQFLVICIFGDLQAIYFGCLSPDCLFLVAFQELCAWTLALRHRLQILPRFASLLSVVILSFLA